MVILISKVGQLANRLWQSSHFIANAIEYDYHLLHKGFGEYYAYFDENLKSLKADSNVSFYDSGKISPLQKAALKYVQLSNKFETKFRRTLPYVEKINFLDYTPLRFYLSDAAYLMNVRNRIVVIDGWFYEDKPALTKHAERIRTIFTPNKVHLNQVDKLCAEYFGNYDYVVGVHIRRGDYKTYNNGIWYYTDEEYVHFLREFLRHKRFQNKEIGLLICSNEGFNTDLFSDFNLIPTTNQFIEDMYSLARCHYIIGPPSTYSAWASFYGNVPVLHIYDKSVPVDFESCKLVDYAY